MKNTSTPWPVGQSLAERLLSEQLNWYRVQRHDCLNHWQVIMGYLQLKQSDKALAYMREALDLEAEHMAGQIADPYVSAVVLGLVLRLRQEGFSARLTMPESFKEAAFWQALPAKKYAETIYGYTTECLKLCHNSQSRVSQEGLSDGDHLKIQIDFEDEGGETLVFSVYHVQGETAEEECVAERIFQPLS